MTTDKNRTAHLKKNYALVAVLESDREDSLVDYESDCDQEGAAIEHRDDVNDNNERVFKIEPPSCNSKGLAVSFSLTTGSSSSLICDTDNPSTSTANSSISAPEFQSLLSASEAHSSVAHTRAAIATGKVKTLN